MTDIAARRASLDWSRIAGDLDRWGAATTGALLSAGECRVLRDGYGDGDGRYRSTVVMARHGYGSGEYRYFAYPLPATVRSEEHTSELQSLMRISYAVFCLTKKTTKTKITYQ